jgi:hypothetical protein
MVFLSNDCYVCYSHKSCQRMQSPSGIEILDSCQMKLSLRPWLQHCNLSRPSNLSNSWFHENTWFLDCFLSDTNGCVNNSILTGFTCLQDRCSSFVVFNLTMDFQEPFSVLSEEEVAYGGLALQSLPQGGNT